MYKVTIYFVEEKLKLITETKVEKIPSTRIFYIEWL